MFSTLQKNHSKSVRLTQYPRAAGVYRREPCLFPQVLPLMPSVNCSGASPICLASSGPFILPASTVVQHSVHDLCPNGALNLRAVIVCLITYEFVHWVSVPWIALQVDPHIALDLSRVAIHHIVFEVMTKVYWDPAALSALLTGVGMGRKLCAAGMLLLGLGGVVQYHSTRLFTGGSPGFVDFLNPIYFF